MDNSRKFINGLAIFIIFMLLFYYWTPISDYILDSTKDIIKSVDNGISNTEKTTKTSWTRRDEPEINIPTLEKQIHDLINEEREKQGLPLLEFDIKLSEIARKHSKDIATRNFFSHENPDGEDPTDRANREGYGCRKDFGSYYTDGIAENIFQNNLYDSITYINGIPIHDWSIQEEIAQSTVQGWMNSPGHRQNILTDTYDKEGIGLAIASDDKVYVTQDFC